MDTRLGLLCILWGLIAQPIPMEHNVFPPFVLVGSTFPFYRHCPSFTPASLLVVNTPSCASRFFFSWTERWSGRIAFPLPHLPGFHWIVGSVGFSLYLLLVSCVFIYACLYRSNAHGSLPADVPPYLIQTTVGRGVAGSGGLTYCSFFQTAPESPRMEPIKNGSSFPQPCPSETTIIPDSFLLEGTPGWI